MNWEEELDNLRDRRREAIITAAEEIFLSRDLASVTMTDIANQAGISRPTLYKYFPSIHDLAFEIQIRALSGLFDFFTTQLQGDGTALQRMEKMMARMPDFYAQNRAHLVFTSLFDHYYRTGYPSPELAERYRQFLQNMTHFMNIIDQGQRDGSIRSDCDPQNTALLVGNLSIAFMQRLASRAEILTQEQGMDPAAQMQEFSKMILDHLSNPKPHLSGDAGNEP